MWLNLIFSLVRLQQSTGKHRFTQLSREANIAQKSNIQYTVRVGNFFDGERNITPWCPVKIQNDFLMNTEMQMILLRPHHLHGVL